MEDLNKRGLKAQKDKSKERLDERKSDATSDKTLADIEESEKQIDSSTPQRDSGPSPDGQFDENSEIGNAGPM